MSKRDPADGVVCDKEIELKDWNHDHLLDESAVELKRYITKDVEIPVVSEVKRGKGIKFNRIRRITGYLTGDINTWNSAKQAELKDRVKHAGKGYYSGLDY
jgi:hypothetical protein